MQSGRKKFQPGAATGSEETLQEAVEALGASRKDAGKPPAPKREVDEGTATSRLMQAKRRAQQKMEDDAKGEQ